MSEAYLITGCQLPAGTPLEEILAALFKSSGLKSNQVNEIHLFSDMAAALFQRRIDITSGPVQQWPLLPCFEINGLFSITRALECGELSTVILAEVSAHLSCAMLLANPTAVGRLNLSPRLRFGRRKNLPEGIADIPLLASDLIASIPPEEPMPEEETPDLRVPPKRQSRPWLAIAGTGISMDIKWPEDRLISGTSLFPLLLKLVESIENSHSDPVVMVESGNDEPGSAVVVMPL